MTVMGRHPSPTTHVLLQRPTRGPSDVLARRCRCRLPFSRQSQQLLLLFISVSLACASASSHTGLTTTQPPRPRRHGWRRRPRPGSGAASGDHGGRATRMTRRRRRGRCGPRGPLSRRSRERGRHAGAPQRWTAAAVTAYGDVVPDRQRRRRGFLGVQLAQQILVLALVSGPKAMSSMLNTDAELDLRTTHFVSTP